MDLKLKDKVFIVTGGAKGIGKAISCELVKEGAIPVIVDRSVKEAKELEKEIVSSAGQCLVINLELGEEDNCRQIVEEAFSRFKRIDGVVNNAGNNDSVGLANGSPEAFRKSFSTNLSHYYDLVHYSLRYLKLTKGSIVNISSKTAVTGQGGTSGYAACKGAQLALTREWAVELAPFGVRVNAVIPAEVMTPHYREWLSRFENSEEKLESIIKKIPLGNRMTKTEEIAAMTVFLLSERSSHTTGQWEFVDGGYVHFDRAIS